MSLLRYSHIADFIAATDIRCIG